MHKFVIVLFIGNMIFLCIWSTIGLYRLYANDKPPLGMSIIILSCPILTFTYILLESVFEGIRKDHKFIIEGAS